MENLLATGLLGLQGYALSGDSSIPKNYEYPKVPLNEISNGAIYDSQIPVNYGYVKNLEKLPENYIKQDFKIPTISGKDFNIEPFNTNTYGTSLENISSNKINNDLKEDLKINRQDRKINRTITNINYPKTAVENIGSPYNNKPIIRYPNFRDRFLVSKRDVQEQNIDYENTRFKPSYYQNDFAEKLPKIEDLRTKNRKTDTFATPYTITNTMSNNQPLQYENFNQKKKTLNEILLDVNNKPFEKTKDKINPISNFKKYTTTIDVSSRQNFSKIKNAFENDSVFNNNKTVVENINTGSGLKSRYNNDFSKIYQNNITNLNTHRDDIKTDFQTRQTKNTANFNNNNISTTITNLKQKSSQRIDYLTSYTPSGSRNIYVNNIENMGGVSKNRQEVQTPYIYGKEGHSGNFNFNALGENSKKNKNGLENPYDPTNTNYVRKSGHALLQNSIIGEITN